MRACVRACVCARVRACVRVNTFLRALHVEMTTERFTMATIAPFSASGQTYRALVVLV